MLSRERIRQIKKEALEEIKTLLKAVDPLEG
jgi:DNA-directed RNA polymerase sigma subunit (sigma70/sigma32)